jgi:hypothetical protein
MIHITDNYYLDSDAYNWILKESYTVDKGDRKGEIAYRVLGFFGKLEQVADRIAELEIKQLDVGSVAELIVAVRELSESIREKIPTNPKELKKDFISLQGRGL